MIFSIVIPTCNRNDLLGKCLERISPDIQSFDEEQYEVIVTDDSKESVSKSFLNINFPWVKWVEGPKKGPAANRNNGSSFAKGQWLVFLDDDCIPDVDLLSQYKKAIVEFEVKVFEGRIIADRNQERFDEHSPQNLKGGNLWSCNFVIENKLFRMLNGFDENFPFPAMEDIDLHKRIIEKFQIQFVDLAFVIHPWRRMKPYANYNKWILSHHYFLKKHNVKKNFAFRYSRFKIFVFDLIFNFRKLALFYFKGSAFYFEKNLFNFLMIIK